MIVDLRVRLCVTMINAAMLPSSSVDNIYIGHERCSSNIFKFDLCIGCRANYSARKTDCVGLNGKFQFGLGDRLREGSAQLLRLRKKDINLGRLDWNSGSLNPDSGSRQDLDLLPGLCTCERPKSGSKTKQVFF